MSNPVLVEVLRGALVESRHTGAVAVVDADGGRVFSLGDVGQPVYPRSAVKALQALPLVESGAADLYGLGPEELALACASHSGEPDHVATATRMLSAAGLDSSALKCGAHWPIHQPSAQALARFGVSPTPVPKRAKPRARLTRGSAQVGAEQPSMAQSSCANGTPVRLSMVCRTKRCTGCDGSV